MYVSCSISLSVCVTVSPSAGRSERKPTSLFLSNKCYTDFYLYYTETHGKQPNTVDQGVNLNSFRRKTVFTLLLQSTRTQKSDVMSDYERTRHFRSHSLKPLKQPSLLTQRSKRTLSLPTKPVIPPLIHVQRYYDNWESFSGDDEMNGVTEEDAMGRCF